MNGPGPEHGHCMNADAWIADRSQDSFGECIGGLSFEALTADFNGVEGGFDAGVDGYYAGDSEVGESGGRTDVGEGHGTHSDAVLILNGFWRSTTF